MPSDTSIRASPDHAAAQDETGPPKKAPLLGKILYGFLFVIVVPALLIVWARTSTGNVKLAPIHAPVFGSLLAIVGATIMLSGMLALMVYGKGLPMNAYPPVHYVTQGIYRLLSHPIYIGFSMICVGVAMVTGSASGLWLVSPVVMLGCVALLEGYEKPDLGNRFPEAITKPLLRLPANEPSRPALADRLSIYVLVLLPWLLLYEGVRLIGIPPDAVTAYLPIEQRLPVWEWTEVFYAGAYPFVMIAPLLGGTRRQLREFALSGLLATVLIILLFLTLPLIAPPRPFSPHSLLGKLLMWERAVDTAAAAFPSFHVAWGLIAARLYARRFPRLKIFWWILAGLIALSCLTTGMHAGADVLGGLFVFLLVANPQVIWERMRRLTERIANSWKEWRIGRVRIINHGFYAGVGALLTLMLVGALLGPQYLAPMMIISLCVIVSAALWAQVVEGSPNLLRPYGWYGGVLGAIIGAFISKLLGASPWLLLAAFSVAAPWLQSAGRLRCLVQGCCHGREAAPQVGIRYTHPRSRVCKLAGFTGIPLHPTPLYSILWNFVVALVVTRLWFLHTKLSLVMGIYLILSGLGRFVEETYRGEPQTAVYAGLRLYQWLAILSVAAGMILTAIDDSLPAPYVNMNWQSIVAAFAFAIFTTFALGVDFPTSNKRFARLI
jgi:protein-S-isoprenylcysteine O-methyltransferase Ste14